MFGINNDKLVEKINDVVLPKMLLQEPEDLIKYNLALQYLSNMSDFKILGCSLGAIAGVTAFACIESIPLAALGATASIACIIKSFKLNRQKKEFDKLFALIITGLKIVHFISDEDMAKILNNISAEDLISFLEKEDLTSKEEA